MLLPVKREAQGHRTWPPIRVNPRSLHFLALHRWLHCPRERIESICNEVQNTGRNLIGAGPDFGKLRRQP